MLYAVTVTNFKGESLRMELSNPEKSGLTIYNITGISAPTGTINTTDVATIDGSLFNSARAQSRNIVLTIAMWDQDNEMIETYRHRTYKYFPVKKPLTLEFETDERVSVIEGYVESNDVTIFTKQEYTQISIICPDPYFRSRTPVETVFTGVDPLFEFIFSNESIDKSLLLMGEIRTDTVYTINYNGDADVGIVITIQVSGDVRGLTIYNVDTSEHMSLDDNAIELITGSMIKEGDIITISTIKGKKYVRLQRGIKVYNILNSVTKGDDWIQITQGANVLAYTVTSGLDNIRFTITNYELYEGV